MVQGIIGKLLGVSLVFQANKPYSYWTSGYSGRVDTDWRASKDKSGGGVLIFNMVHYLDIIRYLTETEIVQVSSDYGTLDSPVDLEDTLSVNLRFENQAIGSIFASSCVPGASGMLDLRIWGTDGNLILRNPNLTKQPLEFITLRQIDGFHAGKWESPRRLLPIDDRCQFVTRFAQAASLDQQPDVTGEDGRRIQALVDAIYRSGEIKQSVHLA